VLRELCLLPVEHAKPCRARDEVVQADSRRLLGDDRELFRKHADRPGDAEDFMVTEMRRKLLEDLMLDQ
jgi:hypothetical protein